MEMTVTHSRREIKESYMALNSLVSPPYQRAAERYNILNHIIASDTVGCGVDFTLNRAFYTKNGAYLGISPCIVVVYE